MLTRIQAVFAVLVVIVTLAGNFHADPPDPPDKGNVVMGSLSDSGRKDPPDKGHRSAV